MWTLLINTMKTEQKYVNRLSLDSAQQEEQSCESPVIVPSDTRMWGREGKLRQSVVDSLRWRGKATSLERLRQLGSVEQSTRNEEAARIAVDWMCQSPNSQHDRVWRWGLQKVIRYGKTYSNIMFNHETLNTCLLKSV